MEQLALLYLATGGLLVGGLVWLIFQGKLRRAEERSEAAAETTRQAVGKSEEEIKKLNEELARRQEQLERKGQELAELGQKQAELTQMLTTTHVEYRELVNQLRTCEGRRSALEEENRKIGELETRLSRSEEEVAAGQREIAALGAAREELQRELAAEKRALEEGLIFVGGSHYLPGRVVRNLIAAHQEKQP